MTSMRYLLLGRRRSATLSAVVAGVAAAGVVAAAPVPAQAQPDPLYRFEHQTIAWHDCRTNPNDPIAAQLAAVGALCGEMTVPLDYRHPDGRTISIAVDRRPATDTAHKLGTLVVNAGGPDESRSAVADAQSGAARRAVAEFVEVGVDDFEERPVETDEGAEADVSRDEVDDDDDETPSSDELTE